MKTMNFSEALRHHEDEAKALGTGLHDLSALVPYALPTNRLHFWGGAWHPSVAGARLKRVNPSTATPFERLSHEQEVKKVSPKSKSGLCV